MRLAWYNKTFQSDVKTTYGDIIYGNYIYLTECEKLSNRVYGTVFEDVSICKARKCQSTPEC